MAENRDDSVRDFRPKDQPAAVPFQAYEIQGDRPQRPKQGSISWRRLGDSIGVGVANSGQIACRNQADRISPSDSQRVTDGRRSFAPRRSAGRFRVEG